MTLGGERTMHVQMMYVELYAGNFRAVLNQGHLRKLKKQDV